MKIGSWESLSKQIVCGTLLGFCLLTTGCALFSKNSGHQDFSSAQQYLHRCQDALVSHDNESLKKWADALAAEPCVWPSPPPPNSIFWALEAGEYDTRFWDELSQVIDNCAREGKYEQAIALEKKALPFHYSYGGPSWNRLADLYFQAGRFNEAESLYRRQLDYTKLYGSEWDREKTMFRLATIYSKQGKSRQMEEFIAQSLEGKTTSDAQRQEYVSLIDAMKQEHYPQAEQLFYELYQANQQQNGRTMSPTK